VPLCAYQGVGVLPYSPLARGLLAARSEPTARATAESPSSSTPRSRSYGPPQKPEEATKGGPQLQDRGVEEAVVEALKRVAGERGVPAARVALAWLLGRPAVVAPIVGATKPGHLEDAIAAVDLRLTDDEVRELEAPYRPREPFGYT
jgi:aryl-alcohol dehydrogenase-like predicted oxidoreductase